MWKQINTFDFVHKFNVMFCEEGKDMFNMIQDAQFVDMLNLLRCGGVFENLYDTD